MRKFIYKDLNNRKKLTQKFEITFPYKLLFKNEILKKNIRLGAAIKYTKLSKSIFFTKIKNTCIITGRSRGVLSFLRLSRLEFKRKVAEGLLPNWYKIR